LGVGSGEWGKENRSGCKNQKSYLRSAMLN
jgi:hypothetical protein